MICVSEDQCIIKGESQTVYAETASFLKELQNQDDGALPVILACLYTNGGDLELNEVLEDFKKDTSATLKKIEEIEARKNGR